MEFRVVGSKAMMVETEAAKKKKKGKKGKTWYRTFAVEGASPVRKQKDER